MYEWNEAIQKMIYWIEDNLTENPTLLEMSAHIGYSPYYCSTKFHEIVGMTIKSYVSGRKLASATIELRDTQERIIDIANKYGYSSQEALTRAFVGAYGCTPAAYRRKPSPVVLSSVQNVLFLEYFMYKGESSMSELCLKKPEIRVEYIPAHKYVGIFDENATDYCSFWKNHDCDKVCGIIDSMHNVADPVVGCHMAGWDCVKSKSKYFYGFGVPFDYDGPVPDGFEMREFPASLYLVFFHPPFDYLQDCGEVMNRVEELAWKYDLEKLGFESKKYAWNEEVCQDYQRHYPEVLGYEVLRPIRRV